MAPRTRPHRFADLLCINTAIAALTLARENLKAAGATQSRRYVARALKSTQGALRNAERHIIPTASEQSLTRLRASIEHHARNVKALQQGRYPTDRDHSPTAAATPRTCRHGDHPVDARTAAAGGEVCFDCATAADPAPTRCLLCGGPHDATGCRAHRLYLAAALTAAIVGDRGRETFAAVNEQQPWSVTVEAIADAAEALADVYFARGYEWGATHEQYEVVDAYADALTAARFSNDDLPAAIEHAFTEGKL
jgi:hypothetical protein